METPQVVTVQLERVFIKLSTPELRQMRQLAASEQMEFQFVWGDGGGCLYATYLWMKTGEKAEDIYDLVHGLLSEFPDNGRWWSRPYKLTPLEAFLFDFEPKEALKWLLVRIDGALQLRGR